MAVYRSDQAQLTMSAEAAPGGDPELISGTLVGGSSDIDTTLSADAPAGATQISVADAEDVTVGDFIRIGGPDGAAATIGTDVTEEFEIRRICHARIHSLTNFQRIRFVNFNESTDTQVNLWTGIIQIELVNNSVSLET